MKKTVKIILSLIILSFLPMSVLAADYKYISLKNGAKAILYLPKNFRWNETYPILTVLHGMGESAEYTFNIWQGTADDLHMILLIPVGSNFKEGFLKKPIDDRENISYLWDKVYLKYNIDREKSLLVGFSRGGNFAVDIGLFYPRKFNKVICIFSWFSSYHKMIATNIDKKHYRKSKFYFITGQGDMTQNSLTWAHDTFSDMGIKTKLEVYPNLYHAYPPDLTAKIRKIQDWIYD
jgi:predicted alpha/beta superfamily hydrolase